MAAFWIDRTHGGIRIQFVTTIDSPLRSVQSNEVPTSHDDDRIEEVGVQPKQVYSRRLDSQTSDTVNGARSVSPLPDQSVSSDAARRRMRHASATHAETLKGLELENYSNPQVASQLGTTVSHERLRPISTGTALTSSGYPSFYDNLEDWDILAENFRRKKLHFAKRKEEERQARAEERNYDAIYKRLIASVQYEVNTRGTISSYLPGFLKSRPENPSNKELFKLVSHLYPLVCDVDPYVYDFLKDKTDYRMAKVAGLESYE